MSDLEQLEFLSLVSKIANEILNHTGIDDKVLAEFVINLHCKSTSLQKFTDSLKEIGAEFPTSFIQNIDRLISALMPPTMLIKLQKSKKKKVKKTSEWEDSNLSDVQKLQNAKFPGLALRDDSKRIEAMMEEETRSSSNINAQIDDLLNEGKRDAQNSSRLSSKRAYEDRSPRARRDRSPYSKRDRSQSPYSRRRNDGNSNDREYSRPKIALDDVAILYKVYDGVVTGIKDFGCFVTLHGTRQRVDGLVHISCLRTGTIRVGHPSEVVERNQKVKVKVLQITGTRISLSIKDVDQVSGRDLNSESNFNDRNPDSSSFSELPRLEEPEFKPKKRLTSPERFEITQLIAAGVLNPRDYPNLNDDLNDNDDLEEDIDIEVKETEPSFLAGQTKATLNLSPIRIVKNPDGTMNRAALAGASLAKERRDLRQQKEKDKEETGDAIKDSRGMFQATDKRTWKQKVMSDGTSFGKITELTIREQRQQLPIYKLRETIIKAVDDNQILVVIGETGSGKVYRF